MDTTHNLVHLALGALALYAATQGESYALLNAQAFGVVYAAVAVVGLIQGDLRILHLNAAGNVLHAIAVATLYVGFGALPTGGRSITATART